jgi:hypothetical protein
VDSGKSAELHNFVRYVIVLFVIQAGYLYCSLVRHVQGVASSHKLCSSYVIQALKKILLKLHKFPTVILAPWSLQPAAHNYKLFAPISNAHTACCIARSILNMAQFHTGCTYRQGKAQYCKVPPTTPTSDSDARSSEFQTLLNDINRKWEIKVCSCWN